MKVLLVYNQYQEPGGEEVVVRKEGDLLRRYGHEVVEYRRYNSEIKQYSSLARIGLVGRTVWASDSHAQITALLRQHQPQVVHVHNTFPLISPSIFWACREERVPVVHTLHNYRLLCPQANFYRDGKPCEECLHGGYWRGAMHGCYRNSRVETLPVALMLTVHRARRTWTKMVACYVTPTAFARSRFVNAGFPENQIVVKPNFVDPDPGPRTGEGSYALFIGRVSKEKGAHTLLEAWRRLPKDYRLKIAGDGPSRELLERQAAGTGLDNVSFEGRVPHEQAVALIKGARFVIFPSELYETFGLGIVEAYACGVPVLASRLGAMQEVVREGHTGLLFQPGDAADLASTVERAWTQPQHMRALGERGRKEYETKYTAAVNYRHLLEIYQQVLTRQLSSAEERVLPAPIVPPAAVPEAQFSAASKD